jgi:ABC-type transport system substrate-binding protein
LVQWRRSSFIALERNPDYREVLWDAEPAADDAHGQAVAAKLKGKRLPLVDRVEVSIIEENQPRWLSFLNQQMDLLEEVPPEFINIAMPNGQLAPNLAKKGVQGRRVLRADIALTLFNMDHPVVGGYTPDKVALRRAIGLAVDVEREIRLARYNMAVPAHSVFVPHTTGFRQGFKSEMGEFNLPKARALLDMHGYVDKDGDGWRDLPDGKPLLIEKNTQPDQQSRALDEQWQRNMKALGVKMKFMPAKWPENLKAARAGKYMVWGVGSFAASGDGQSALQRVYGPMTGGQNMARFKHPEMDAIFDKMSTLPDGPERDALARRAEVIAISFMPMKAHVHRLYADLWQPWLVGFKRPLFWQDWWHRVDIDTALLPAK